MPTATTAKTTPMKQSSKPGNVGETPTTKPMIITTTKMPEEQGTTPDVTSMSEMENPTATTSDSSMVESTTATTKSGTIFCSIKKKVKRKTKS